VARSLRGKKLGDCHIVVELPSSRDRTKEDVKEFLVPEGKALVQVGAEKIAAGSLLGRAVNYAANVAGQIRISDDQGTDYFAIGVYSVAPVNGKMTMEIQYHPDAEVPERCLEKPKTITAGILTSAPEKERKFGYLFLVNPGTQITRFSAGKPGSAQPLEIAVP
jgi:hypothetical protein